MARNKLVSLLGSLAVVGTAVLMMSCNAPAASVTEQTQNTTKDAPNNNGNQGKQSNQSNQSNQDNQGNQGNQGSNGVETLKEGIYIGILSFDEESHILTETPVLLDNSGVTTLKNLLDTQYKRAKAGGTLLYYTVHKALSTLRLLEPKLPVKTTSCNIITFTDGIDVGSTSPILWNASPLENQNFGGKTGGEYLAWLNGQLENTKIKGNALTASAYGIAGDDVNDREVFAKNLKNLKTQSGESDTAINFDQLSEKFGEIAKNLTVITKTTSFDLLITPPTTGNGTIYKMTFDAIGQTAAAADTSAVYFTGVYKYNNGVFTLSNIVYNGINCAQSSITGVTQGNKIKFHFDQFDLGANTLEPNNIQQWFKGSDSETSWQRNSEYDQSNTTTTKTDKSSAVIYLALDSSKSLSEENINKVRNAAKNFIKVLYERYNQ